MAVKDFETELNLAGLTGTLRGGITKVTVDEKDDTGVFKPNQIIRTDHDWRITVDWQLVGTLLASTFFTIPGKWVVTAYLEGWGKNADEKELSSDVAGIVVDPPMITVPANPPAIPEPEWRYSATFSIPKANTLKAGPYRLAVTITYQDENGKPGPMAGFIEIADMVQIYVPG
jgi:hypothetical protein